MNDFFGEELNVGNTVAFSSYHGSGLGHGKIIKLTEKMVKIKVTSGYRKGSEILRDPSYLVKYMGNNLV